ncbi:MAG: hypothetical protein AB8H79_15925 [Myxococcota bacterium]
MRFITLAALLTLSTVAVAAPAGSTGPKQRVARQLEDKGVSDLLNRRCDNLAMVPAWGGIRPVGKGNNSELKGAGLSIKCTGGQVRTAVVRPKFKGDLPKFTTFEMRQKDVWKVMKNEGMKDRSEKGKDAKGAFVKLTGKTATITWRWADAKGKGNVDRVVMQKR